LAACEAEAATYAVGLRVWPGDGASAVELQARLRDSFTACVGNYMERHPGAVQRGAVGEVLEVGCSVGVSTRALGEFFPEAQVTGLDLSPYMLSVADFCEDAAFAGEFREAGVAEPTAPRRRRISYRHGLAESSGYADGAFDLVSIPFVFHECPERAIRDILSEQFRVLRPGGVLAFTDNDPRSPVIQGLPAPIFTLMKSTEPWSDEYYLMDIPAAMREAGFVDVEYHRTDPRHRTVVATKPRGA